MVDSDDSILADLSLDVNEGVVLYTCTSTVALRGFSPQLTAAQAKYQSVLVNNIVHR
jgi:hypothetical protein